MKSLVYLSSIFLVSLTSFFIQSELNVKISIPQNVSSGQSFLMDLEIDKGDIANFSKLQLNLPNGFTAELIEGRTGTFTFYDQKMKLIWISLPEDPIFNVQVKIIVDEKLKGKFNFDGKISYVVGSERKEKLLESQEFNVVESTGKEIQKSDGLTNLTQAAASNELNTAKITCSRQLDINEVQPGQIFKVSLTVDKKAISGLGKIIDNIPSGFSAIEDKNNGAIFSTKGNQVKFLWMTLPSEDQFEVSYKLKVNPDITGNKVIDGKMSYILNDETKTILIDGTNITIKESQNSEVENSTLTSQEETTGASDVTDVTEELEAIETIEANIPSSEIKSSSPQIAEEKQQTEIKNSNATVDQSESKKTSVNYRVQICATRKQVNTDYFVKNHNINEQIFANLHEGWHKYTIGEFDIYKNARNHRENVKAQKKITGPFVTAYTNGKRITVQEALMITKDQWIQ